MGVATRDIAVGSLVHIEQPTAFVPYDKTQPFVSSRDTYSPLEESMLSAAFSATGESFRGFSIILAARVVSCARFDESTAMKVKALCKSATHHFQQSHSNKYASAQIVQRLLSSINASPAMSVNDCYDILEKLESNAFSVVDHDMSSVAGIGLYTVAAAINHSCDPNCYQTFDLFSAATLSIRASRNIKKGEEISIAYIDIGKPTSMRRRELSSLYGFFCSCTRCSSLSSGSYLCSSLNCGGNYEVVQSDLFLWWKGYIGHPESPLNTTDTKPDKVFNSVQDVSLLHDGVLPSHFDSDSLGADGAKRGRVRLQCSLCCRMVSHKSIMKKVCSINSSICEMEEKRRLGKSSALQCKKCTDVLLLFKHPPHFTLVELYRNFILDDLILKNQLRVYVQTVRDSNYLDYLSQCYPLNHPFPAIQKAMYSKCLLGVWRTELECREACAYIHDALQILRVTHGEASSVVKELKNALESYCCTQTWL
jgi:SET domain